MIPKIICFLFGHQFYIDYYSGKTETITDNLTGNDRVIPITYRKEINKCERCGKEK